MIKKFTHKGLKNFYIKNDTKGILSSKEDRIRRILERLEACIDPEDMNLPGYDFHGLSGKRKGTYSVKVFNNWKITYTFINNDVYDVNLEDYH